MAHGARDRADLGPLPDMAHPSPRRNVRTRAGTAARAPVSSVSLPWNTFNAIYLINLPERVDRRRELASELNSVGLSEDDERVIWMAAVRPPEAGGFPSIGSRGCFMSHLECLKSARARGFR